jgi:oligopeptide transport system ATP-binding protein
MSAQFPTQAGSQIGGQTSTQPSTAPDTPHLLEVQDLHVEFRTFGGILNAVNGVSYTLDQGETLAILGESGSGKTVSAETIMGLIETPPGYITNGHILYRGKDLLRMPEAERREIRGRKIAMIFQDALTALNPSYTVGFQIGEMFRIHLGLSARESKARAIDMLDRVQIPSAKQRIDDYPFQFSGGMRQRVMIAVALALNPEILIADEPTTALDVTIQAQIMDLLAELKTELNMALILITHDLGVVADVADRVAVMYAGRIVEGGPIREIFHHPAHPYTKGLLASIPRADQKGNKLSPITGTPPNLSRIPLGCPFHPRCPYTVERCREERPIAYPVTPARYSACHLYEEVLHG